MAMTFQDLYERLVADGYDDATASETTEAKQIINDAVREFLAERPWSFATQVDTLEIAEANDGIETLPSGFASMVGDPVLSEIDQGAAPHLRRRTPEEILRRRIRDSEGEGIPLLYAIRPVAYAPATGTQYEILTWPLPDADYDFAIRYRYEIAAMTDDAHVPPGGDLHAPTILQCARMLLERRKGETSGPQAKMYYEAALPRSVRNDSLHDPRVLGRTPEAGSDEVVWDPEISFD